MRPESARWICEESAKEGLPTTIVQAQRIYNYQKILVKWNRTISLVSDAAMARIWEDHLLEGLWLNSFMPSDSPVADFGSGAGIPGIILACLQPNLSIHLIEARAKKARFLKYSATNLGLDRVQVINRRVDAKNKWPGERYPTIVSRAAAEFNELLKLAKAILSPAGRLIALVGERDLAKHGEGLDGHLVDEWTIERTFSRKYSGKVRGAIILQAKEV